ncbi:MAG: hypothetical protein EPO27_04600 [Betaproteobacteria bacterium]|nr:MAG: hypothetical protein EPO27_04600 [Betaproteobacteria bacterium]
MRARVMWLLLALAPIAAAADENPLGWSYVDTKDLRLIYFDALSYLGPHAVRTFTNSLAWQRRTFGWNPSEPTTVLLKDLSDYGNASAGAVPHGRLIFDIAPQSHAFETYPASERLFSLMNHELIHVATNDISAEEDRGWRRFFFGKIAPQSPHPESLIYSYLTVPRYTASRWYLEGSAVFMETWMGGGLGRAQGGYDEMVFRAMVRDNAHFYDPLGLASRGTRVDFQVGANAYLYGTRFFTWLSYAYSPEKVVAWLRRDAGSKRYYADQFRHVFGITLEEGWQNWIAFEREFQRRNLAEVRKFPITPHHKLAASAVGSISRMYYDEASGVLYAAFRYPGVVEHVGALNTRDGGLRRLADIKRAMLYRVSSFAFDPGSGTAFYTDDNLALRDLMAVDVKSGESRMLLEDARIGEIVFNPVDRSLLGVRHVNGLATLVRIPHPYTGWTEVHTFPYEHVPSDLDISPDGRLLSASMSEVNGDQFLRVWELKRLLAGDLKPLSEFRFGQSVPESFVFSRDGRYLYGSSYYTGVSNIFRYEVATGAVEAVTNAESGYFRPVPLADGRLVVLTYTAEGFVPAIIEPRPIKDVSAITFLGTEVAAKHPVVTTWQVPPPKAVDETKLITGKGAYYPPRELSLANAYPVVLGYKNSVGIGYHVNIEDALGLAALGITAAYTPAGELPASERPHLDIKYRYLSWRAGLAWNRPDFYDLFGPTKRSRKGLAANVGHDTLLIYDEPRKLELKADLAYYDGLDTLPQSQNVAATATRLRTGSAGLYFTDVRRSLGAVDDEKGLTWNVVVSTNHAGGETIPLLRADLDFGFALPLAHSSIWLRNSTGIADGERADPYANFFLGGFGNNYVDNASEKRYRERDAFPGFEINEIGGRSYTRHMLEWNLPPHVFESAGTPAFHLTWLRPAVFASALWTEPGNSTQRRRYGNLGAQVDLRFSVLHWYDMTLSLGYAVGYRGGQRAGNEWMISLKIM